MSNQPSVFISSNVKEFRDLRSAIAFTLREQGFTVYQSEASDFDVKGDRSAIEECFTNINNSDFYILIVGNKKGNLFEDGISITRQEYRIARSTFMSLKRPRLFFYLRRETEMALQSNQHDLSTTDIDDSDHLKSFINEIQNPNIAGAPNFLTRFYDFNDLMQSLVVKMNLGRNLSEKLIRYSLLSELLSNLAHISNRSGTSIWLPHHFISKVRERVKISIADIDKYVNVKSDLALSLGMALVTRTRGNDLSTKIIKTALDEGLFLIFDHTTGSLKESELHSAIRQIIEDIESFRTLDYSGSGKDWSADIAVAVSAKRKGDALVIPCMDLSLAFAYYDRLENIFNGHLAFCRVLLGLDEQIKPYKRQPLTVWGDTEDHQMRKEKVSEAEISHLIQNNIWPLGTKVPRDVYGASREEQIKTVKDKMLSILGEAGIDSIQFKETMEKAAINYLDKNAVAPEEGIQNLDNI